MKNADYRRNMGMDMPVPTRDIASERYTVTSKSHVEPEKPKLLKYSFIGGVIMVDDGSGPRVATAEEIEQLTGGVMCWPTNEDGEL